MLVLLIDSATPAVVVGLADGGQVVAEFGSDGTRRHGAALMPGVQAVLAKAGRRAAELEAVVVGVGPGPFTGLRIGLVSAAALGDALDVPVHGVGSLDAVALGGTGLAGTTYVVTDARRREVYWARYVADERVSGPAVGPAADVLASLAEHPADRMLGAGAVLYQLPGAQDAAPSAAGLLAAATAILDGPAAPLRAAYLRRPDATEPRPRVLA